MVTVIGPLATQLDQVGSDTTYIGEALPGASLSDPVWRIKKVVDVDSDVTITWADGNGNLDNVWDDRLSLTYL